MSRTFDWERWRGFAKSVVGRLLRCDPVGIGVRRRERRDRGAKGSPPMIFDWLIVRPEPLQILTSQSAPADVGYGRVRGPLRYLVRVRCGRSKRVRFVSLKIVGPSSSRIVMGLR